MKKVSQLRRLQRTGQAVVEGALVLLAMVPLIVCVMDFWRILLLQQMFAERVRAGVRYAAVSHYDPSQITNFVLYNSPTAPAGNPPGLLGLPRSAVSVTRHNAGDRTLDRIEVQIQNVPITLLIPFVPTRSRLSRPVTVVRPVEGLGASS